MLPMSSAQRMCFSTHKIVIQNTVFDAYIVHKQWRMNFRIMILEILIADTLLLV